MGTTHSNSTKKTKGFSAIYHACEIGDLRTIQIILPTLSYDEVCTIEPNGSTSLHAAVSGNKIDIVQMLLEHGCDRSKADQNGHTAYELAKTDAMRDLFRRSNESLNHFFDANVKDIFQITVQNQNQPLPSSIGVISNKYLVRHRDVNQAKEAQFMTSLSNNPMRKLISHQMEKEHGKVLQELVNYTILHSRTKDVQTILHRFDEYHKKEKYFIEHLIYIYTMDTQFYSLLRSSPERNSVFTTIMFLNLSQLRRRAFAGVSYRGATMTDEEINAYFWALQNQDSVVEASTFLSTSEDQEIGMIFAQRNNPKRHSVLTIFHFPSKCETAIRLLNSPDQYECISAYSYEKEVLVLPFTLFKVVSLEKNARNGTYELLLIHVPTPDATAYTAWFNVADSERKMRHSDLVHDG